MADMTSEQWLDFLEQRLSSRRPSVVQTEDYYLGKHPLTFATAKFREAFGDLFSAFADNMMQLVVDVPVSRLGVVGFDYGDESVNTAAWKRWQQFNMSARAKMAHTEAGKAGVGYVLVDTNGNMTVEHALNCIVELDPADPLNRLAGLKKWESFDGYAYATLYLPDRVYKYRRKMQKPVPGAPLTPRVPVPTDGWESIGDIANPFGVVPLIPMENNPSLTVGGIADLLVAMPIQNAINKLCTDMIVASEFQAFKQRVITGVETPRFPEGHPLAGELIPDADVIASMSRAWFVESPDARAFELGGVDLSNYVTGVDMFVAHLATKTQIPPQYFLTGGAMLANISAEAMAVIESGFVSKIEGKQESFGPAWSEAVRLSLSRDGQKVDPAPGATKWRPASPPAIAQLADAMVKYASVGVPYEWIWRQIGATPEEVIDWRKQLNSRTAPLAPAPTPPAGQDPAARPSGLIVPGDNQRYVFGHPVDAAGHRTD